MKVFSILFVRGILSYSRYYRIWCCVHLFLLSRLQQKYFLDFCILCVAGIWWCPVLGVGQLIRTVSATAPQLIHTDSQLHQIYGLFNHFHTFSIARSSQFICMVIIIYEEENTLAYQTFHTFPIFFTTRGLKKKGEGCR